MSMVYTVPCIFNFYAEYMMGNVKLDESQAEIKIVGKNSNNLRYTDDTSFVAESEEELKSLLMKVKEESEKVVLKLNLQKLRSWLLVPSVHFSRSVVSNSLPPHGLQQTRTPCPLSTFEFTQTHVH